MLQTKLDIDSKDVKILSAFMRNPDVSQSELAELLKISQPSVNVRVRKLKERGLLTNTIGIEFNKTAMYMVRVDFTATHAQKILELLRPCSFFVNGFVMSGKNNVSILIVGHDLKKVETIINTHLRTNTDIKDITTSVVVSTIKPFVYSVDLEREQHEECKNVGSCDQCPVIHK